MFDEKLELRKEMKGTWLIQRLRKSVNFINPFSFGGGLRNGGLSESAMGTLNKIMSFDYMGSTEFEWGAVPSAFQFIAEQASKKNIVTIILTVENTKNIYCICPKQYSTGAQKVITSLLGDEYKLQLKEHCGLKDSLNPKNKWDSETVGWLELDNGFMFFTDEEMYNNVCNLFGINKEATK